MPNGHGGIPYFGAPVLLGILTALLIWWYRATGSVIPQVLIYISTALFGWRLAFHLTMWDVMEYGGGYTSEEDMAKAKRKFMAVAIKLIPLSLMLGYWLTQ